MGKTMHDLMGDSLKDKYFQRHEGSFDIVQFREIFLGTRDKKDYLSVWVPLEKKNLSLPLEDLTRYQFITDEKFREIEKQYESRGAFLLKVPCTGFP